MNPFKKQLASIAIGMIAINAAMYVARKWGHFLPPPIGQSNICFRTQIGTIKL